MRFNLILWITLVLSLSCSYARQQSSPSETASVSDQLFSRIGGCFIFTDYNDHIGREILDTFKHQQGFQSISMSSPILPCGGPQHLLLRNPNFSAASPIAYYFVAYSGFLWNMSEKWEETKSWQFFSQIRTHMTMVSEFETAVVIRNSDTADMQGTAGKFHNLVKLNTNCPIIFENSQELQAGTQTTRLRGFIYNSIMSLDYEKVLRERSSAPYRCLQILKPGLCEIFGDQWQNHLMPEQIRCDLP